MVLKKAKGKITSLITRPFQKPRTFPIQPLPPPSSSYNNNNNIPPFFPLLPPQNPPYPRQQQRMRPSYPSPFRFPATNSTVLPDPSSHFTPELLSSPLPTNSFFQNFVLKNGDQPEYIHPYLIRLSNSSLSVSYPTRFANSSFIYQVFNPDFTITGSNFDDPNRKSHKVSNFSDLSVTVDFPAVNLRFFLVRGSPFITCVVPCGKTSFTISTIHAILSITANVTNTKYVVKLNNGQTWVIYASSPINFTHDLSNISSDAFCGIIRVAVIPNSDGNYEPILDRFSSCYPVSGNAVLCKPFGVDYKFEKRGWGDLLMLAHPLHLKLLSNDDGNNVVVLDEFKYKSIDGDLVGVVGDSWSLRTDPVSITWHSNKGVREDAYDEIVSALSKDVASLDAASISTTSSYFYGKLIARAARMALIAEEVCYSDAIPVVRKFLRDAIQPWLDGTFNGNGFLYDGKWGGIVTKQGATDSGADFGFGVYNDHHYHLGYFLYGIAVLAKIDPAWGRKYRPQAYSLMADFMNLGKRANSSYTRLRCFDMYKLHSWASGLTEFADGRNQESTSEAVNGYYSAALMGLAYGDTHLVAVGSTLAAIEMQAAQTWWHVREGEGMYEDDFSRQNKMVGVLWGNKRDSGLWFAPPDWKECRLGIQVLPILPITEALFPDTGFVKDLVNWTMPALSREGVGEGWKGFVYTLEGLYDKDSALNKIRNLKGFDDGNSLSNLLWWIHSRGDDEECRYGPGGHSWYGHYCH
ncbi:glucan endo-1,3-beta-D-glucosidase [Silene latifolia]|uniref:glucan endo-1,3-beta-D-glucosidase n=1 Tax=Silene latifolia TaxID=37657 RepID=UPI003D782DAE